MRLYVDDLMAAVRASHAPRAQALLEEVIAELLGESAVAKEKTEVNRHLVCIGWDLDLTSRTTTMSRKTLLKTIYFLKRVSADYRIQYVDLEVLGALTERFSGVAPKLTGFKSYLYKAYKWRERHSVIELDDTCVLALHLCRSLVVAHLSGTAARYSFDSLVARTPNWVVEYDGSIFGIGGRVFEVVGCFDFACPCPSPSSQLTTPIGIPSRTGVSCWPRP